MNLSKEDFLSISPTSVSKVSIGDSNVGGVTNNTNISGISPKKSGGFMKDIYDIFVFYIFRFSAVIIALFLAYLIVSKILEPDIADKACLTNTQNCSQIDIYRYQNNFIAQENISQIWFWYNGDKLYVYGQAAGSCESQNGVTFVPVSVFQMSLSNNLINFTQFPNECIPDYDTIISAYKNNYNTQKETLFLYREDINELNTIFSTIKNMYDNKIFVL